MLDSIVLIIPLPPLSTCFPWIQSHKHVLELKNGLSYSKNPWEEFPYTPIWESQVIYKHICFGDFIVLHCGVQISQIDLKWLHLNGCIDLNRFVIYLTRYLFWGLKLIYYFIMNLKNVNYCICSRIIMCCKIILQCSCNCLKTFLGIRSYILIIL